MKATLLYSSKTESPEEVINVASKEEVRALARKDARGETLTDTERATIKRTTDQAGEEGRLVTRLQNGESK
jgi:hypothetical protein